VRAPHGQSAISEMLITCRTPLRISLLGGGTDYPEYLRRHRGAVIGFTIDKYIYISALSLASVVDYRYRLSYSRLEMVDDITEIEHPVIKAVLTNEDYRDPTDYSIQADLPASAGLGSSSAFTVGFLNLISALKSIPRTKLELARLARHTEHVLLNERVGVQDQLHAAFGGVNRFGFEGDQVRIEPIDISGTRLRELAGWLILVYTGFKRHASTVLEEQTANTVGRRVDDELAAMLDLVDAAQTLLARCDKQEVAPELARLLSESWELKKRLSRAVTNSAINALYKQCVALGALGGKLCGAGGGGFLLMVVPPEQRSAFVKGLGPRPCIDFAIEHSGSTIFRNWDR